MSKQLAVVYFNRDQTDTAKSIANAIRNQGHLANMVYATNFQDAADCVGCATVAIQVDSNKAAAIAAAYRRVAPETEVHFFNAEGDFVDGPEPETVSKIEMPSLATEGNSADANADADQADPDVAAEASDPVAETEAEVVDDGASEVSNDEGDISPKPE